MSPLAIPGHPQHALGRQAADSAPAQPVPVGVGTKHRSALHLRNDVPIGREALSYLTNADAARSDARLLLASHEAEQQECGARTRELGRPSDISIPSDIGDAVEAAEV